MSDWAKLPEFAADEQAGLRWWVCLCGRHLSEHSRVSTDGNRWLACSRRENGRFESETRRVQLRPRAWADGAADAGAGADARMSGESQLGDLSPNLRLLAERERKLVDPLTPMEAGAILHAARGKHPEINPCAYCIPDGWEALKRLREKQGRQ